MERCLRYIYRDFKTSYPELLIKTEKVSSYMWRLGNVAQLVFDVLHKNSGTYVTHGTAFVESIDGTGYSMLVSRR